MPVNRQILLIVSLIAFLQGAISAQGNGSAAVQEGNIKAIPFHTPVVGAIRWDGWIGDKGTWQIGPIVERTLGPSEFHYRAPFFSVELGPDSISIDGTTQEIMDREIAYAKDAGIDYWAYCWYPDGCGLEIPRKLHQASEYSNDVKWCVILGAFEENIQGNYGKTLVEDFSRDNYQKVCGGRPLIYLYSSDITKAGLDKLRKMAADRFIKTPYVVVMDWSEGTASDYCTSIGADAISSYAELGRDNLPFADVIPSKSENNWNSWARIKPVVPWVSTGWNPRPRMESENPWSSYYSNATNCQDASAQDIKVFLARSLEWTLSNPDKAVANTVIIYAWNEHDEGFGAICPTLGAFGEPNTERLDSVRSVLSERETDTALIQTWSLNVTVKDAGTLLPLEDVMITVNNVQQNSDSTGTAFFSGISDYYDLLVESKDHFSLPVKRYAISSDTAITLYLSTKTVFTVTVTLLDSATHQPFRGAAVVIGNTSGATDADGKTVFSLGKGIYNYFVNKLSYRGESGEIEIRSDTSLIMYLVRTHSVIKFRLKEDNSPVNYAVVYLGKDSAVSGATGIALFNGIPINQSYTYSVLKQGYKSVTGELINLTDTIIDLQMEKDLTRTGVEISAGMILRPNPATDLLSCSFVQGSGSSEVTVTDITGKTLLSMLSVESNFEIEISGFPPGIYIIRVKTSNNMISAFFIKK
jgi:hypothetical protein